MASKKTKDQKKPKTRLEDGVYVSDLGDWVRDFHDQTFRKVAVRFPLNPENLKPSITGEEQ